MLSYGELYQEEANVFGNSIRINDICPDVTVKGNNGFRFGIAIALQISSLHPVIGYDHAGKSSFTTNVIYFKQQFGKDKTPDEIAKDKGYVRGAKTEETPAETTEAPAEASDVSSEEPVEAPESPAVEEAPAEASTDNTFDEE